MADDVDSAITAVAEIVRDICGAARVEWREDDQPLPRVVVGDSRPGDSYQRLSLGPAGSLLVVDGRRDSGAESVLAAVAPLIRRRYTDERLAKVTLELARQNEALEDFAALVAHELKAPLQAALAGDDQGHCVRQALDLVDALLEAARDVSAVEFASPDVCLREAIRDLAPADVEITADLPPSLPLPATPLRLILRNLLRNAAAAGAEAVHVSASRSADRWLLVVEDNGAGFGSENHYRVGSGLGLDLCRRIVRRHGGSLDVAPAPAGGTQARLLLKA